MPEQGRQRAARDTSQEAYVQREIRGLNAKDRERVYALVLRAEQNDPPGITADQIEAVLGGKGHQRLTELEAAGRIVRSEERRKTRLGGMAAVYRADSAQSERLVQPELW